jgi:hypothetical protein
MNVMGRCNVKLQLNGITEVITAVYYIRELKNNLLSIGQLQQKNLTFILKNNWCKVYNQSKGFIMTSQMASNKLYPIKLYPIITEAKVACFQTKQEDMSYPWHCRFGHLGLRFYFWISSDTTTPNFAIYTEFNGF